MKLNFVLWIFLAVAAARNTITSHSCNTSSNESRSVIQDLEETLPTDMKCSTTNLSLACRSPWQYCDEGECRCGKIPRHATFHCNLRKKSSTFSGYCVTMQQNNSKYGYSTYVGKCAYLNFYHIYKQEFDNFTAPLEIICEQHFNRTGILCGACKEGHYPLVYSFDINCVECSNKFLNIFKFIMAAFLPLTAFYFVIVLFNINVTSSYLTGYVLCCQGMVMPIIARRMLLLTQEHKTQQMAARVLGSLLSIWNLDIFRFLKLNICLGTDSLQTLALDLVVGIYPHLLIILSYILIHLYDNNVRFLVIAWKPFKIFLTKFHKTWNVNTSLIDAFAAFTFLSNLKFLNVSIDLLTPVSVYELNATGHKIYSLRLYYDATVLYFGRRHLPYGIIALAILTIFVITPALLQILYPFHWFQKLLNLFPFRWYVLHTFMDTFQGCYKDGTEPGTRDCRWFASVFFLLRIFGMTIGTLTLNVQLYPLASMLLVITSILIIAIQPYKLSVAHYSTLNASFLLLLAVCYMGAIGYYQELTKQNKFTPVPFHVILALAATVILLYISAIILKWMWSQRKFGVAAMKKFHARRRGYILLKS